ncbi:uncharacterized protein J8A68_001500 [[Candida] subhashii]|uniref:Genetic interactor of prohibitin 5, mitochondrial n=1 Tax=[Candida] subhashii TaxID=561895 RepID=A0A8J5QU07_9ASCO|nr:uncharacterized protein J8A68_001500 [[Candida] subhashii]KAG7664972.1 hypothetical protein J8A68_001500 [[Candida] subhashii]
MKTLLKDYKSVVKQIRRLPLPSPIIQDTRKFVKKRYRKALRSSSSTANVHTLKILLDDILIEESYTIKIPELLDTIYKGRDNSWIYQFHKIPYIKFKPFWPQIEMINEIGKSGDADADVKQYNNQLKSYINADFSVTEFLGYEGLDSKVKPLELYKHYGIRENPVENIFKRVDQLYKFILNHKDRLEVKPPIFEILYPPTNYGLPIGSHFRDRLVKTRISQVRQILTSCKPMLKKDIIDIAQMVNNQIPINPNYYKYIHRKQLQDQINLDPIITQDLRKPILNIDNDDNFYLILREWLTKQFYLNRKDNKYEFYIENYYDFANLKTE